MGLFIFKTRTMKKIFTFCALLISVLGFSQTSMQMIDTTFHFNVPDDSILARQINPGAPTKSEVIDVQNTSTVTNVYCVIKRVIVLNQALTTNSASPYFCFGASCYGSGTYTSLATVTLSPGQKISQLTGVPKPYPLSTDFDESPTIKGYSFIKYTIYNVNNLADSVRVGFKFNSALGIENIANVLESVSNVYPNPSHENASVAITLKSDAEVKVQVYNSLGALVFTAPIQKFSPGKHNVAINCSDLNSGLYFVSVLAGENKITKRLIVNK